MSAGIHIVAGEGAGTKADPRRPKYIPALGLSWTAMDYGAAPFFVVRADLSAAQETTLGLNADAFTVPALDVTLNAAQVTALQTRLEAVGIPAGWITTARTWRQVLRAIAAMCQLAQAANVSIAQANLDQTMSQIAVGTRNALQQAAIGMGFGIAEIQGSTTVRAALKILADQWTKRMKIGDIDL